MGGSRIGSSIFRAIHSLTLSFSHPPLLHLIDSLLRIEVLPWGLPCLPTMSSPHLSEFCHLDAVSSAPPPPHSIKAPSLSSPSRDHHQLPLFESLLMAYRLNFMSPIFKIKLSFGPKHAFRYSAISLLHSLPNLGRVYSDCV